MKMCQQSFKHLLTLFLTELPVVDCQPRGDDKVNCEQERQSNSKG